MRTGVKVVFVGIAGEGSFCVWMLFSLHLFLPITNMRESKGTTANTEGYRHYTLRSFLTLHITSSYQPVK